MPADQLLLLLTYCSNESPNIPSSTQLSRSIWIDSLTLLLLCIDLQLDVNESMLSAFLECQALMLCLRIALKH